MPLIEEFLSPPVSYPPVDSLAQLFQVFCSFHLRLHQPATQTFLDLLDDYYFIFASESFAIQDLWAIIQDPRKLNRALLVSHDSIGELAVHGYRRFLHFCLDFYELWKGKGREQDPAAAALVEMMRQHFQYWFLAFSNKDIVSEQLKNAKTLPDDLHEREEGARQIKEILAQLAGVENLPPPEEPDGVQRFLSKCWGWLVSTW